MAVSRPLTETAQLDVIETSQKAQPQGLYLLFFTELWERFGFYTLQTIIILYMTQGLFMRDSEANLLYAAFSSLLYLMPTIGGYLADHYLGFQRAILIGGMLFIIAYFLCASSQQSLFFLGLSTLICANGFFKPNVSSLVGELYKENDPRRDGGFTLFYMGINIGALIPPLIAGSLVVTYGWHAGFYAAAAGMILGQVIFLFGRKKLNSAGLYPKKHGGPIKNSFRFYAFLTSGILGSVALCQLAFRYPATTSLLVELSTLLIFALTLFYLLKEPRIAQKKMVAALVLTVISFAFWTLYNQAFTSLMLFADRNMAKNFLGFPFDAEATQFLNPFFIIALSPLLSRLWLRLDKRNLNPSTQMKFFLGMLFMSLGYFLLAFCAAFFSKNGLLSPNWIALSYLFQTIGELFISPIGLAMITVLAPKHLTGMMMGVWFFAQAASFAAGGFLANIAEIPANLTADLSLPIYSHAFVIYGLIGLSMTLVSLAFIPFLNRMIRNE